KTGRAARARPPRRPHQRARRGRRGQRQFAAGDRGAVVRSRAGRRAVLGARRVAPQSGSALAAPARRARRAASRAAANPRDVRAPGAGAVKSESSRDRILEGAAEEFAASGFAGARIDRISRRTRLNVRMIYYHFASKRGLYRAVLQNIYEEMSTVLDATERSP